MDHCIKAKYVVHPVFFIIRDAVGTSTFKEKIRNTEADKFMICPNLKPFYEQEKRN